MHHGMPDFICYRRDEFKFVECKLGYEKLREGQKKCIQKLLDLGFNIEIYILSEPQTKVRVSYYNLSSGEKTVREVQKKIKSNWIKCPAILFEFCVAAILFLPVTNM